MVSGVKLSRYYGYLGVGDTRCQSWGILLYLDCSLGLHCDMTMIEREGKARRNFFGTLVGYIMYLGRHNLRCCISGERLT